MPRTKRVNDITRLNLEVRESVRDRIERLKTRTEAESITEVIRRSLSFYEAMLDIADGRTELVILSKNEKEQRLILIP